MPEDKVDNRPICFVVMGFGKKTDFESGRTFDLDRTYEGIIAPASIAAGFRPIRADEILHSSVIDLPMYEMLLRADVVVADISTANPNAIYELGVRHALRPRTTIIMKEDQGRYFFDLNHSATFNYRHLGEDIGYKETIRAQKDLENLIISVTNSEHVDSPVYTFIPELQQPRMSDADFAAVVEEAEDRQEHIMELSAKAEALVKESSFSAAVHIFDSVHRLRPNEPHFIQRLVLAKYKSKVPTELTALMESLLDLQKLDPENSNDPETLGLAGAIHKRLWLLTNDRPQLDKAIDFYRRGFEVRRDYYNGENAALCYDLRSSIQTDDGEKIFDRLSAKKIRLSIVDIIDEIMISEHFPDRRDRKWIFATMANVAFALGLSERKVEFEAAFLAENPADWEVETFKSSWGQLLALGYS